MKILRPGRFPLPGPGKQLDASAKRSPCPSTRSACCWTISPPPSASRSPGSPAATGRSHSNECAGSTGEPRAFRLGISSVWDHVTKMRLHAILIIAAGVMIALSVILALRPHHDKQIRPPHEGLTADQCATPPNVGLFSTEQTCGKP